MDDMQLGHLAVRAVLPVIGMTVLMACSAQESRVPVNGKAECVGRMRLNLPGVADVAANSFKMLESEYKIGTQQPRFEFEDGQEAGYSSQHFLGSVFVSHPLSKAQRDALLAAAKGEVERAQAYAKRTKHDVYGKPLVFEALSVAPLIGYASRVNSSVSMTVVLDDRVMVSNSSSKSDDWTVARKSFDIKIRGVSPRPMGQLPNEPGVCLPYAFIRDDGVAYRSIGLTYRLQDHPDVTIWLEDSSASAPTSEQDPAKFTAEYRTDFFWHQDYQDRKSWRSIWSGMRDVKLDGRKGVASFVELKREDDTLDFGYLAVVRGDPQAKEDAPDLMLYVIRDAKNAIAKGKQPITRDELLEMAQGIAASVKHRAAK